MSCREREKAFTLSLPRWQQTVCVETFVPVILVCGKRDTETPDRDRNRRFPPSLFACSLTWEKENNNTRWNTFAHLKFQRYAPDAPINILSKAPHHARLLKMNARMMNAD